MDLVFHFSRHGLVSIHKEVRALELVKLYIYIYMKIYVYIWKHIFIPIYRMTCFLVDEFQQGFIDFFTKLTNVIGTVSSPAKMISWVLWSCGECWRFCKRTPIVLCSTVSADCLSSVKEVGQESSLVVLFTIAHGCEKHHHGVACYQSSGVYQSHPPADGELF